MTAGWWVAFSKVRYNSWSDWQTSGIFSAKVGFVSPKHRPFIVEQRINNQGPLEELYATIVAGISDKGEGQQDGWFVGHEGLRSVIEGNINILSLDVALADFAVSVIRSGEPPQGFLRYSLPDFDPDYLPPTIEQNSTLQVTWNSSAIISASSLRASGPAHENTDLIFAVSQVPSKGTLQKSNVNLTQGSSFTQEDINLNRIRYAHNGAQGGSDLFKFTLRDHRDLFADEAQVRNRNNALLPTIRFGQVRRFGRASSS